MLCQPHSVDILDYRIWMNRKDSKRVLWENVSRLMVARYGKENLTRLAADAKVGPGTSTRIKEQETSVGTDKLDLIAKAFGIQTWQLLVPGLDPDALPVLGGDADEWPMPMVSKNRFLALPPNERVFVQGYMTRLIEEREIVGNRLTA